MSPFPESRDPAAVRDMIVSQIKHEAEGVVSLTLASQNGEPLPHWGPGSHLEITLPSGLIRQYSLCGHPDHETYTVAVLREELGRGGSREIHDIGLVGRTLAVRGPRNLFRLEEAESYLLIAGGIGVTPLLAMARDLDAQGRPWRMVYGGRSARSMAFVDELHALRGDVEFVPEEEAGYPDLARALDAAGSACAVYACGPPGLLDAVSREACTRNMELHIERFTAQPAKRAERGEGEQGAAEEASTFELELRRSGVIRTVEDGQSILDVVRETTPDAPSSCEAGFCGSCETRVLDGTPDHSGTILEGEDSTDSMMICTGRSLSKRLILDV